MKALSFVAVAALFVLGACATPTPYQPKDKSGYGFSDSRIEGNRYRLAFRGNALTEREQVENALLYRAAELTLADNFDYFVIAARDTDVDTRLVAEGPRRSPFYFSHMYYAPRLGWRPWYDPFWDEPANYRQVTRYDASAEIALFKGKKPAGDPMAFDAREVEANLRAKIVRPAPAAP